MKLSWLDRIVGIRIHASVWGVLFTLFVFASVPVRADAWGIEIPANFGKWFLAIKDWYVQNQRLIAQGRQLYVQYNRVRQTYDLLQGLSDPDFRDRWSENLETLAVANAAFYVNEALIEGDLKDFYQQLLGLSEKAVVVPHAMKVFSLELVRSKAFLRDLTTHAMLPPNAFPKDAWLRATNLAAAEGKYHLDYPALREQALVGFYEDYLNQNLDAILDHPLSPMAALSRSRIFSLLFDPGDPFHSAEPLQDEVLLDSGGRMVGYEAFLGRRILSELWLKLGDQVRTKLADIEAWLSERALKIRAAAQDTLQLVDQINDLYFGFRSLTSAGGNAGGFATALSLAAGGASDEVAEGESRTTGFIKAKLEGVVQRAQSVAANIEFAIGEIRKIQAMVPQQRRSIARIVLPELGTSGSKPIGWSTNQNGILQRYLEQEAL